jgi:TRAP-type transport system periplasmic protein
MRELNRRSVLAGAAATSLAGVVSKAAAQAPIKLKLGNDLPATHSVNVPLREAIDAVTAEPTAGLRSVSSPTTSSAATPT